MKTARLFFFAVLASACSDLEPLELGICGNGVLEENEECDFLVSKTGVGCGGPRDGAFACRFFCSGPQPLAGASCANGSVCCPTDGLCGGDGFCRVPSSGFLPSDDFAFVGNQPQLGDFDGDGLWDLVGNSPQELLIRYGDGLGHFTEEVRFRTDLSTGRPTVGLINSDPISDVILPLTSGLYALLGSDQRTFNPVINAPFGITLPGAESIRVVPVAICPPYIGHELMTVAPTLGGQSAIEFPTVHTAFSKLVPESLVNEGALVIRDLDASPVSPLGSDNPGQELILSLPSQGRIRILSVISSGTTGFDDCQVEDIVPYAPMPELDFSQPIIAGPLVVDWDGDGYVDIMAQVATLDVIVALRGPGGALRSLAVDRTLTCPELGLGLPLAIGQLGGDAHPDLVYPYGIVIYDAGDGQTCLGQSYFAHYSPNLWSEAIIGDFGRDGLLDVAAIVSSQTGVEYLINAGGLFNSAFIDHDGFPSRLRTGDFDGDLVLDLAFLQSDLPSANIGTQLTMMFGAIQGPLSPPVYMGHLGDVRDFEPAHLNSIFFNPDATSDMVISLFEPDPARISAALLRGTSERRMVAPFSLTAGRPPDLKIGMPFAVEASSFDPMAFRAFKDAVVLGATFPDKDRSNGPENGTGEEPWVWLLNSNDEGRFTAAADFGRGFLGECARFVRRCSLTQSTHLVGGQTFPAIVVATNAGFCGAEAEEQDGGAATVPPGGDGGAPDPIMDRVAALAPELAVFYAVPSNDGSGPPKIECPVIDQRIEGAPPTYLSPNQIQVADLDQDQLPDLIVSYAGTHVYPEAFGSDLRQAIASGAVQGTMEWAQSSLASVVVYWNEPHEGRFQSKNDLLSELSMEVSPFAAVQVSVDADGAPELAILTPDTIEIVDFHGRSAGRLRTINRFNLGQAPDPVVPNVTPGGMFLVQNGLQRISVADLNSDRMDDFVISSHGRVEVMFGSACTRLPFGGLGDTGGVCPCELGGPCDDEALSESSPADRAPMRRGLR